MRIAVLVLGLLGALLFGGALVLSWLNPLLVERGARELVRIEVERRVGERIDELSDSRIAGFAQRALRRTGVDVDNAERQIREQVPRRVAEVTAAMLDSDVESRKRLVKGAEESWQGRLAAKMGQQERLTGFIESAYASVTQSLLREFRIFTATNALAFALLALVAFVRKQAKLQLLLPAIVIVGAVLLTGGLYLFNQDWLHTIVFGDYVGWGYAAYLSGVTLLLADILLNRARVSTHVVNGVGAIVGVAVLAVPC